MKFVFWQNVLSPHQSFFIKTLAKQYEVILAVEKIADEELLSRGWEIPDYGETIIIDLQQTIYTDVLQQTKDFYHIFSGINSYPILSKAFKIAIVDRKISIISESPIQIGWRRHLRKLLYSFYAFKYNKRIDHIFAMGTLGYDWFKNCGFSAKKISKFQYTIELPIGVEQKLQLIDREDDGVVNFVFIGQMIYRKGIDHLIWAMSQLKHQPWRLHLIGDGELMAQIKHIINSNNLSNRVKILGTLNNRDALDYLLKNGDYLVLPSRFDGWGAVVNEALSRGVKVITNKKCGASCLVTNYQYGEVYKEAAKRELERTIVKCIKNFKGLNLLEKIELAKNYSVNNNDKVIVDFIRVMEN